MRFTFPGTVPRVATRVLAVAAAGLAVACSSSAPQPPTPTAASTPASAPTPDAGLPGRLVADVTGDGAFRHLEELQRIADANNGNRALGTPGYDASVEYVARTLRDAGYAVETPEFTARSFSAQDVRLTVDGALPIRAAIERIEWPVTNAREISSRSTSVSASWDRRRCGGWMPLDSAMIRCIDEWPRSNSWAIWCIVHPSFHRAHIWAFWASE